MILSTYMPAAIENLNSIFLTGSSYEPSQTNQTNYEVNYNLKTPIRFGKI